MITVHSFHPNDLHCKVEETILQPGFLPDLAQIEAAINPDGIEYRIFPKGGKSTLGAINYLKVRNAFIAAMACHFCQDYWNLEAEGPDLSYLSSYSLA